MTRPLTVRVVADQANWLALASHWQRLHDAMPQNLVFNSWLWNRLWWEHYGFAGALHVLVVQDDTEVVGILPAYIRTERLYQCFEVSTLRLIGDGGDTSADGLTVLVDPTYEKQVATTLVAWLQSELPAMRFRFCEMPESSGLACALQPLADHRELRRRRVASLPSALASWRQQISRNTHKRMKRRRNRLDGAGSWRFFRCTTPTEVESAFTHLIRLHHLRRVSKGGSDSFSSAEYLGFHRSLVDALLVSDQLWLMVLELDGQVIGVEYAFADHGTLAFFQTGFDPAWQHLSPGHIMMSLTIARAIEGGIAQLDLLRGDYPYKSSYASEYCTSINLQGWLSKPTGVAFALIDGLRQMLRRN